MDRDGVGRHLCIREQTLASTSLVPYKEQIVGIILDGTNTLGTDPWQWTASMWMALVAFLKNYPRVASLEIHGVARCAPLDNLLPVRAFLDQVYARSQWQRLCLRGGDIAPTQMFCLLVLASVIMGPTSLPLIESLELDLDVKQEFSVVVDTCLKYSSEEQKKIGTTHVWKSILDRGAGRIDLWMGPLRSSARTWLPTAIPSFGTKRNSLGMSRLPFPKPDTTGVLCVHLHRSLSRTESTPYEEKDGPRSEFPLVLWGLLSMWAGRVEVRFEQRFPSELWSRHNHEQGRPWHAWIKNTINHLVKKHTKIQFSVHVPSTIPWDERMDGPFVNAVMYNREQPVAIQWNQTNTPSTFRQRRQSLSSFLLT